MSSPSFHAAPRLERWLPWLVWAAAALLGALTLTRGWLPHDAGALGQASERVLAGELPHRDFYDTYTGGLALLNALAFKVFGVSVMSMRLVFFAAWLLWIPAFWAVARRVAGPWPAAVGTLLAAAASLPGYPEGMPSWYNLFLATGGTLALLRHREDGRRRWIVLAGVAGGVSILFKVIGLYFLAGAGLYLIYQETVRAGAQGEAPAPEGADRPYRAAVQLGLAFAGLAIASVVLRSGSPLMFLYFGLPPLAAVGVVTARLARPCGVSASRRFGTLVPWVLLLGAGAALPVAAFAVPYLVSGSLGALWEGVFVLPQSRFLSAAWAPPPAVALLPALGVAGWLVVASRLGEGAAARPAAWAWVALLMAGLALSHTEGGYRMLWFLVSGSGVVLAGGATWLLSRRDDGDATGALLLSVFALHALVQVPFAAPIYALYAFPVMVLLALAVADQVGPPARHALHAVLGALLVFVVLRVDTGFVYHMGFRYRPHNQTEVLDLPRSGGIRVSPEEKAEYEALVATVASLDPGSHILAFPDSPEVYFLTGLGNPTPTLFDFLDPDPQGRDARALQEADAAGVKVAVLNRRPLFSGPADAAFLRALERRYPSAREVGRFLVVWRPDDPGGAGGGR